MLLIARVITPVLSRRQTSPMLFSRFVTTSYGEDLYVSDKFNYQDAINMKRLE